MIAPGKILKEVLAHIFKKPATENYPANPSPMAEGFRGKLNFFSEKCIGCKMCMRDCPANAITIRQVGEKKFECEVDLSKCISCAQCVDVCPKKALEITKEFELAQLDRKKLVVVFPYDESKAPKPEPPKQDAPKTESPKPEGPKA
ncbi:MAG: 4Fe-4S binding protein [Candidatus Omnitrophica bacterium]|nr:4Fe-4S binding protein [Candidatus Omnitrophota bacterium]